MKRSLINALPVPQMNALIHVCDRSVIKMTKIKKNKRQTGESF